MTRTAILASTALVLGTLAAHAQQAINGEGSSLASPTYTAEFAKQNVAVPAYKFSEYSTSSGKGLAAFQSNAGTAGSGVPAGVPVDWAASDSYLVTAQVSSFNSADAATTGNLIQIPVLGVAIAIPFKNASYTGSTGANVKMTDGDLCAIFSGKAKKWSDLSSTATGGSTAPFSVVYRADNSGTSFLLTQHLGKVCTTTNSNFTAADLASMPRQDFYNLSTVPSLPAGSIGETGSSAVATELESLTSAIGYLSPDYTSVPSVGQAAHHSLLAASVRSPNGTFYQPTYTNTSTALSGAQTGGVNVNAPSTNAAAAVPTNWVPALPQPKTGYPVVGYTNWFLATCYQGSKAAGIVNFLTTHYQANGPYKSVVTGQGFLPVTAASYITALNKYILGNSSGANLNLGNATACAGKTGR